MDKYTALHHIINDIKTTNSTSNIKSFKENIYEYKLEDLYLVNEQLEKFYYFGQHGVNDMAWFELKQIIKEVIKSKSYSK